MLYKIKFPEAKEWNGKRFVEAVLEDPNGEKHKVSAWSGEFDEPDGSFKSTVDVELYKNDKGYMAISKPKKAAGGAYMNAQRVEGQKEIENIRNEHIKQNMKDKEESIAWFNSRNLAINFVEKYVSNPQVSGVEEGLSMVRKYTDIFFKDWQNWSSNPF